MRGLRPTVVMVALVVAVLSSAPTFAQALADDDGTTLLDPGAEPRRELRYAWSEGYRERATATLEVSVAASESGVPVVEMRLPLTMRMLAGVTATGDDGSARIVVLFEAVEFGPLDGSGVGLAEGEALPPEASAGLDEAARLLEGVRTWQVMDARGGVIRSGAELPEGVPVELQEQLATASGSIALLPKEAVGIGARWETTGTTISQGIEVGLTTEIELVAMDGDDVTLAMTMRQPDGVDVMPPTQNPFETFTIDGDGLNVVDLAGIFPRELTMGMLMTMAGDIPTEGDVVEPVEMNVAVGMRMEATPE